ncbi:MAG: 2-amino-4-hydroxy-6-hydroxymethyldihydropteridine diphosphokinase [Planctomycetia bacterium]|nr:2-amino-4-hydroxy-6-hydroxymethyldihydropteridine diphosphokinase [Planctomycetia bacterium]
MIRIKTGHQPHEIKFDILRKVEERLVARSVDKFAPRTIDLDLILYGTSVINGLTFACQIRHFTPIRLWPFRFRACT